MNLIKKVKKKLLNKLNYKSFASYEEALRFCEKKTKGAYESEILSEYRFRTTKIFLENESNILAHPSMPLLMFALNYYLRKEKSKTPGIIDFGGACGVSLIFLHKIFSDEIYEKSWIIESPQIVKESKNWEFAKNIKFASNLNEIISKNNIDIFFTSSCIQYLKNPFEILTQVAESNISLVVLTRNHFSSKNKIRAQISFLSENGGGSHLKEYKDNLIYYPNTSIDKRKVIDLFVKNGYSILINTRNKDELNNYDQGGDLIFSKFN
tara:strand:+ start:367 stop:1164 length:798 start_codon:yes stop_codon:yes gene_type:complete